MHRLIALVVALLFPLVSIAAQQWQVAPFGAAATRNALELKAKVGTPCKPESIRKTPSADYHETEVEPGVKGLFPCKLVNVPEPVPAPSPAPAPAPSSAAAIFYTDILSGPNTGGEGNNGAYLSIFGKGFGGAGTVTIGGGQVARVIAWADDKVSVQLGAAARTGKIVVNGIVGPDFTVRPGNFWWIALTGNDATCVVNDINRPCRTPNKLRETLQPGDFIIVRGGNYDLDDGSHGLVSNTFLRAASSGTAGAPITFMAHPGEPVVIQQDQPNLELFSNYLTIDQWVVAGFKVYLNHCISGNAVVDIGVGRAADQLCVGDVRGHASNVRVVNLDIDGRDVGGMCNGDAGYADGPIIVSYADNIKILGVAMHNTGKNVTGEQRGHLIYLGASQTNTEIGWNKIYKIPHSRAVIDVHTDDVSGNCYGKKRLTDIAIHDNVLYDIAGQAIDLDGAVGDVTMTNNLIFSTPTADDHRYEEIVALRAGGRTLNAKMHNNTIVANPYWDNKGWMIGFGFVAAENCPEAVELRDNIFVLTGDTKDTFAFQYSGCGAKDINSYVRSSGNIWFGGALPSFAGAGDVVADPKLSPDFRPTAAIAAGKGAR